MHLRVLIVLALLLPTAAHATPAYRLKFADYSGGGGPGPTVLTWILLADPASTNGVSVNFDVYSVDGPLRDFANAEIESGPPISSSSVFDPNQTTQQYFNAFSVAEFSGGTAVFRYFLRGYGNIGFAGETEPFTVTEWWDASLGLNGVYGLQTLENDQYVYNASLGLESWELIQIPEPSTAILLGLGLLGMAAGRKRRSTV